MYLESLNRHLKNITDWDAYTTISKGVRAPNEDSDQPVHLSSLNRGFDGRSMDSQESNVSKIEKLKL